MTAYSPRESAGPTARALKSLPVVVLTGLRQAGKSTFLEQDPIFEGFRRVTLDDFAQLEAARRDPDGFVSGNEPLIVDEAHRCPDLLIAVKRAVDRRRKNGRFVLSGSANLALLKSVSESLAGRASHHVLRPMTRREIDRAIEPPPFLKSFFARPELPTGPAGKWFDPKEPLRGGLPPVALDADVEPDVWFSGYERTYVERDVRDFAQIPDLAAFRVFLRLAALRGGQVLNASNLARDAKLTSHMTGRWLGVLEASYLLRRLPPSHGSKTTRLVKSPKLYVEDSGLAAHLIDLKSDDFADDPLARGVILETYVAQNLVAIVETHLPACALSYWNVQGRYEVDFVIADRRGAIGIEVKADARLRSDSTRGLEAFLRNEPLAKAGILAYQGRESVKLGDRLFAIPIGTLLA